METTLKLAIETYSELTGRDFQEILSDCLTGNEVVMNNIKKLMFSVC